MYLVFPSVTFNPIASAARFNTIKDFFMFSFILPIMCLSLASLTDDL